MTQRGQMTSDSDPLVESMKRLGAPLTRKNYLDLAYPDNLPSEWTAELEAELPPFLQQPLREDGKPD